MKKSTQEIIDKHLGPLIGDELMRTKPACGDWSYTDGCPVLLVGFTSDGCIIYRHTGSEASIFGNNEFILPIQFTDSNWITYKEALKADGKNELNKWKGKKIRRIRPTSPYGDRSFMNGEYLLVSASKYHMVIMYNGSKTVLRSDYMNPADWELVE